MSSLQERNLRLHRIPLSKSIDAVRFLPSVSAFDRHVAAAVHSPSTSLSSLEIHSFSSSSSPSRLSLRATWPSPSRITSLARPLLDPPTSTLALSTSSGSLHLLSLDPLDASRIHPLSSLPPDAAAFHRGPVSAVDVAAGGRECATAGEDGRVHLVAAGETALRPRRVYDAKGLASYTAVRWASPREFATGGYGLGVQLWDPRRLGGPAAQLKGNWMQGMRSGIVHSIDIHPSRQHICIVGGSSGTVFAWDLRWQQRPILLSGFGENMHSPCESEVWEVQCDSHIQLAFSSGPSTKVLPVMMCSEDGILAVLHQDEEPIELLAENCAINSFDIDPHNPSDVVCALEWESILILTRPRGPVAAV